MRAARGLVGVAGDLDGQRGQAERAPEDALDDPHRPHPPDRARSPRCARRSRGGSAAGRRRGSRVKPPNATTEPSVESAHASDTIPIDGEHDAPSPSAAARAPPARPRCSLKSCWMIWPAPASTGTDDPELPGGERGDREIAAGELPPRSASTSASILDGARPRRLRPRGAQLLDRVRGQRRQRDLPALVARAGLDVDREDPEQPLQRALVDVDRLDPVEPDVGDLLRQRARQVVDRLRSDVVARRLVLDAPPIVTAITRPAPP